MLVFRICNFIRGYVVINLNVSNYEKTLNLLRKKGIKIWDIEKNDNGIKFKITYNDYKKYSKFLNELNIQVIKKSGVALKYTTARHRKGFGVGIGIIILCFFIFSHLVWNIEVIGADQTFSKEILKILNKNNINMPLTAESINSKFIETVLYKNFANLKFVEAYVEGSKLIIFVKEKNVEESVMKENTPTSIISTKNAIISKILAKNGQPVVRVGDVVYEGQTLVMGIVKNKNSDEFMMVPSEGTIYGKTYYNFELKGKKVKNVIVSTNQEKSIYFLKLNGKNFKIIGDTKPFKNYNYREREFKLPLISDLFNISFYKGKYYEERTKEIKIDENTAQNVMKVNMYDDLIKMVNRDSKIINTTFKFQEDDDYYYLSAQIEVIEDIGKKVKIYPSEEINTDEN